MNRLKQLRIARGLSLDQLAAALSNLVTKQSLSKYETGQSTPSPSVATKLAEFFGITAAQLWAAPKTEIKLLAYRKMQALGKKAAAQLEASVAEEFERRVDLQERCLGGLRVNVPIHRYPVSSEEEAEHAAMLLRAQWQLGVDPIGDVIALFEEKLVHVIEIPGGNDFDGLSAVAFRTDAGRVAAAVVSKDSAPSDRQRFNLVHELAHIVMQPASGVDEERMANRFAGAFLIPSSVLIRELGASRTSLSLPELEMLKRYFKASIQCIVVRAFQLGIISKPTYSSTFVYIDKMGWRKNEPSPIPREKSEWKQRIALRGYSEGVISRTEAEAYVGAALPVGAESGKLRRKDFLKLTDVERENQMREQSEKLAKYYENSEWEILDSEQPNERP
jgi:Zn-dependent peptidase ImmA (M78 family)/DNA-binding XRE family transcriptional regulator